MKQFFKVLKANPLLQLVIVLVLALLVAFPVKWLTGETTQKALTETVVTPVCDAFLRGLNAVALPVIFLSLVCGIAGFGDTGTFGRIGAKLLLGFLAITTLAALLSAPPSFYLSGLSFVEGVESGETESLFADILNIIPDSVVSPFTENDCLQVIFLGILFGVAILLLEKKLPSLVKLLDEVYQLFQTLLSWVGALILLYVFLSVLRIVWQGEFDAIVNLWRPVAIHTVGGVILMVVVYFMTKNRKHGQNELLDLYAYATVTASGAMSMERIRKTALKLGVSDTVTDFGVPLGMLLCKPASAMYLVTVCCYWAKVYDVPTSASWLALCLLLSVLLVIAIPPVAGGGVNVYVVLFAALNIPLDVLAPTLAVDVLMDHLITGFNVSTQPCMLSILSKESKK